MRQRSLLWLALVALFALLLQAARPTAPLAAHTDEQAAGAGQSYPILFVTQVPVRPDFTTIGSTFGNHMATLQSVARGGDLWIRYPDGTLKNLTATAGYGSTDPTGFQGDDAIAVRDPSVHWSGTKALFSMVIGGADEQYEYEEYRWQLYEITGLGQGENPMISPVPNQPADFNNISPLYGTDDRILFTSDRPRSGEMHLYPQRDEYELAPVNTGIWSLEPTTGDLRLLNHAPSGNFTPILDSYGRVLFTQWDHLQRDQQADADAGPVSDCYSGAEYGTFNYSDESASAVPNFEDRTEVFPEPRGCRTDLLAGTNLVGHTINHFFPWTITEDGMEGEILNHLGRHELHGYIPGSLNDDPNVIEYYGQYPRYNPNRLLNLFQIKEDPLHPGSYYGIDAPEFGTHASGQVVSLHAPPSLDADHIAVTYETHRATFGSTPEDEPPSPDHSGHYRDPLPLSDGTLIAAHTAESRSDGGSGPPTVSRYDFRLKSLVMGGNGFMVAGPSLTSGIVKTVRYWSPDMMITYTGPLWELNPVEVRPRPRPTRLVPALAAPELQMFEQADVSVAALKAYLEQNNLALIVSRNVTTRDDFDRQQPYNLRIAGGGAQTTGSPGRIYDVSHMQFFQADQLRGWTGCCNDEPYPGRRVLARVLHDANAVAINPPSTGPAGSVVLASDGSMAAFVPARRAMTWQLTAPNGSGVVRERYWLTFQPGEMRVCASCHGLSEFDQAGQGHPVNPPDALYDLLLHWKNSTGSVQHRVFLPSVQ